MLECVSRHLRPDGIFAASLPNSGLLKRLPLTGVPEVEDIFPHPSDGQPVQVSSAWRHSSSIFTVYWYYDHLLPDGQVQRLEALARHHLLPTQLYLDELQQAGFKSIQTYGDFDRSSFDEDSPYFIFVAKI